MELSTVVRNPYFFLLPIGFVIVCAMLVFAFGFKSSVEPNFRRLSDRYLPEERKGKKRKLRERRITSVAAAGSNENVFARQDHDRRPSYSKRLDARMDRRYGSDLSEKPKIKKILRDYEKPVDYDDGEWETAFSRKVKKNKKKDDDKGQVHKHKETHPSNKVKAEHKGGGKGKPGELRDRSDASLFVVSSLERLELGYPVRHKKKKKVRTD